MKTPMKLEDLFEAPHFRSIIFLTIFFQDRENGLKKMHYRWALVENYGGVKRTRDIKEMARFFSEEAVPAKDEADFPGPATIDALAKTRFLEKNCIKGKYANQNLQNFLADLIETYKIMEKDTETGRYRIRDPYKILNAMLRSDLQKYVQECSDEEILRMSVQNRRYMPVYDLD
jgi:hypothetical protein